MTDSLAALIAQANLYAANLRTAFERTPHPLVYNAASTLDELAAALKDALETIQEILFLAGPGGTNPPDQTIVELARSFLERHKEAQ